MLARLMGKVTGTDRKAERANQGTGDRNVGGRQGGTTPADRPPDDEGSNARNIGG